MNKILVTIEGVLDGTRICIDFPDNVEVKARRYVINQILSLATYSPPRNIKHTFIEWSPETANFIGQGST